MALLHRTAALALALMTTACTAGLGVNGRGVTGIAPTPVAVESRRESAPPRPTDRIEPTARAPRDPRAR